MCHPLPLQGVHELSPTTLHVQEVSPVDQECGDGRLLDVVEGLKENTVKQNVRILTQRETTNIHYTRQNSSTDNKQEQS